MFSKVVPVNEITSHDHQDFYDKNPMMRLIGVNVDPEHIAIFKAIESTNNELPVHECVSYVEEIVPADNGYFVHLKIHD